MENVEKIHSDRKYRDCSNLNMEAIPSLIATQTCFLYYMVGIYPTIIVGYISLTFYYM